MVLRSKCKNPNCSKLIHASHSKYCYECQTAREQRRKRKRSSAQQRIYSTARWRKTRLDLLQCSPICGLCNRNPSHVIDHITPLRVTMDDAYNRDNLIALCKTCHDSITRREIEWADRGISGHAIGGLKRQIYSASKKSANDFFGSVGSKDLSLARDSGLRPKDEIYL